MKRFFFDDTQLYLFNPICFKHLFTKTDVVRTIIGNMCGLIHIQTKNLSYKVLGETRKNLSIEIHKKFIHNESALETIDIKIPIELPSIFISRINRKGLFKKAITKNKLQKAWLQLKGNPKRIPNHWFKKTSDLLNVGTMQYFSRNKNKLSKSVNRIGIQCLTINNFQIQIIEKAIINAIESIFKESFRWIQIYKKGSKNRKSSFFLNFLEKQHKEILAYFKEIVSTKRLFKSSNDTQEKFTHQTLHQIRTTWSSDITYLLAYEIQNSFNKVQQSLLRGQFNQYVIDPLFFNEIEKILNIEKRKESQGVYRNRQQCDTLPLFFLNTCLYKLDRYIEYLNETYNSRFQKTFFSKDNEEYKTVTNYYRLIRKDSNHLFSTLKEIESIKEFQIKTTPELNEYRKPTSLNKSQTKTNLYIHSVRYAKSLLIGIIGSQKLALQIQTKLNDYIQNSLHLKLSKGKMIGHYGPSLVFLGHNFRLIHFYNKVRPKSEELIDFIAIQKIKNRILKKFKLQDRRLVTALANRHRSKILKEVNHIIKRLKLDFSKNKDFKRITDILTLNKVIKIITKTQSFSNTKRDKILQDDDLNDKSNIDQFLKEKNCFSYDIKNISFELKKLQKDFKKQINIFEQKSFDLMIDKHRKKLLDIYDYKRNRHLTKKITKKVTIKEMDKFTFLARKLVKIDLKQKMTSRISIKADLKKLTEQLRTKGFVHPIKDLPTSCARLLLQTEPKIIRFYNNIIWGILYKFAGADNFRSVHSVIESILRISCSLTLKRKFKMQSKQQVINLYGTNLIINNALEKANFTNKVEISYFERLIQNK